MLEIMYEYDLLAGNTIFKLTRRKAARNMGSATYCISKAYVQPKHKMYRAPTLDSSHCVTASWGQSPPWTQSLS